MIVVSNSGPLMALAKLGLLELLPRMYGQVWLPTAVVTEVVVRGGEQGYPDALLVQMAIQRRHLMVTKASDAELPADIANLPLDAGEKETIHVALRDKADLVLLDDLKARDEARSRGLDIKGTLGIILQAHRAGLLPLEEVQTIVGVIIARDDIWIAEGLCREVLARLKEQQREEG